jgi:hypothetical protein
VSRAYHCEKCDGVASWRMDRRGDAAVSWSCNVDVDAVLLRLQRGSGTEIVVRRA